MKRLAAFALATALVAAPAVASEKSVSVSGPWITLGDVADASGPLAKVRVAPSPEPGQTLALDPNFVGNIARANGVYFPASHTGPIRVSRTTATHHTTSTGQTARTVPQNAPRNDAQVLVLTRDVKRGDILSANDMEWIDAPTNLRNLSTFPRLKTEAIGKEVRRTLRAGREFRASDLATPALIAKGDPVTLIYASGGLTLTVSGRALTDAAANEPVRIMNNYSKRAIDAVATGAGEAHVRGF